MRWRRCLCALLAAGSVAGGSTRGAPDAGQRTEFDQALADFDQAQDMQANQPGRARQLFRSAAQRFESIVAAGVRNGKLEFNLGNCYQQAGDIGLAILHYLRAKRLTPRDPLLADNLSAARSRCLTTVKPTRQSVLLKSALFWHYDTSPSERVWGGFVLYVAFWVLLTLRRFVPRPGLTFSAVVCAALASALAASVGAQGWGERRAPAGVVSAMDVTVYKGPGTGYQRQFEEPLQPGVEFTLRGSRGDWWTIELPDGKSGWIESATADLIVPVGPQRRLGAG